MPCAIALRLRALPATAGIVWILIVCAGVFGLHVWEYTPGGVGPVHPDWPEGSTLQRAPDRPNLVMFAHPRCPCSKASVEELALIVEQCGGDAAIHVVFFRPVGDGNGNRWAKTALWDRATALPGVRVLDDPDGTESARFGAETSGHVLLYDRTGRLKFSGGVTAARGRGGANPGRDAVVAILTGGLVNRHETPVFGCSIRDVPRASRDR